MIRRIEIKNRKLSFRTEFKITEKWRGRRIANTYIRKNTELDILSKIT